MAVDSQHLHFSPLLLFNRDLMMNSNNNTTMEPSNAGYCTNNQTGYGVVSPFSVTDDSPPLLNMYGVSSTVDTVPTTTDSFTANHVHCDVFPLHTKKRSRDSTSDYHHRHHHLVHQNPRSSSSCVTHATPFSFLGQDIDISSHINQQQHEIDRFLSLHMERMKLEIQERRKRQARTIMEAIEHGLVKRFRVKEAERDRIGKINHALEERVKSLSVENQFWRDLAQTNEATANNLRTNLEQILAQVKDSGAGFDNVNDDDAQSCCGSSSAGEETVRRMVATEAHDKLAKSRMCRNCGEEESCVLLLPCRHMCLCGVCGSGVHTCPICFSPKNASVHVNMSS